MHMHYVVPIRYPQRVPFAFLKPIPNGGRVAHAGAETGKIIVPGLRCDDLSSPSYVNHGEVYRVAYANGVEGLE